MSANLMLNNQFGEKSNNIILPAPVQTLAAAGAISTTIFETILNNASVSNYAVTLAAPAASQDGQLKLIKLVTATHAVTLAMTNIKASGAYTPTGTTTLTFTSAGDCAVLMAVASKWIYLGGTAVAS